jgi:hypothetical protein
MAKKTKDTIRRNTVKRALKETTAELTGVNERSVRRVLAGDQVNEKVMATYMELWERYPLMVEEVKRIVLFDNQKTA